MRILFCGDVVGRSGREAIEKHLPQLKEKLKLDFIIVNGENAASGFGVTRSICENFVKNGADVITGGDHIWDQKETYSFITDYPKLLRPHNFPEGTPGTGARVFTAKNGKKVLVLHLLGQLFMKYALESPFEVAERVLEKYKLHENIDAIIVDIHAEATSEKVALGHFLDGRVSLVCGSHTHIPTADHQILENGTAYITDAGMCGDYDSVIGFNKKASTKRFLTKVSLERLTTANNEGTLSGVFVELSENGLAKKIAPVRIGGKLEEALPVL